VSLHVIAERLPTGVATEKLFEFRKLWLEGALDSAGGDARLKVFENHPNTRVAKLAGTIRLEIAAASAFSDSGAMVR
jgi:hypothetical protein